MKLIIVGFLVTPRFDGSFYIYNHLVRPCLSMDPHYVLNWLIKLLESFEQHNPLTEPTEPEALQNLIALKPAFEQHNVEQKDIDTVEITEKNEVSAAKPVTQTEMDFGLPRTATSAQTATAPIVRGKDLPDLIASKKLQKVWICATSDQADIISQLQGKKHADHYFEKIKPKEQGKVSAANSAESGAEISDFNSSQALWTCVICKVKCSRKLDLISHFQGQRHAKAFESLKVRTNPYYFKPWTCGICQVTLENKNDLILHLQSRRHSATCEHQKVEKTSEASSASSEKNLNFLKCDQAMNLRSRSVVEKNMNLHLHGNKHLARTEAGAEAREIQKWTRVIR